MTMNSMRHTRLSKQEAERRAKRFEFGYEDIYLRRDVLESMNSGQLVGLRKDAGAIREAHHRCANRLLSFIASINHILRSRESQDVEVSDHAVVRYLERVEGIDVQAIRDKIAGACDGVQSSDGKNRVGIGDGFLACTKANRVQTILSLDDLDEDTTQTP